VLFSGEAGVAGAAGPNNCAAPAKRSSPEQRVTNRISAPERVLLTGAEAKPEAQQHKSMLPKTSKKRAISRQRA